MEPAAGVRPSGDGLQHRRVSTSSSSTPDVLAKIFQGQITKWNDPAIAALNSGATLPRRGHHADLPLDPSGTTDNFQKYLAAAAPQARGPRARARSSRVAQARARRSRPASCRPIQATPAAIGYVEKSLAAAAGLKNARDRQRSRCGRADDDYQPRPRWPPPSSRPRARTSTLDLNALYAQQGSRCLPVDAGDLRDRLQQGLRRRHGRGGRSRS